MRHILLSTLFVFTVCFNPPAWAESRDSASKVLVYKGEGSSNREYLSTKGNQIVNSAGTPIRLSCVAFDSYMTSIPIPTQLAGMKANGFNCTRVQWYDAGLSASLAIIDQVVTAAKANKMMVIIDHHSDEGDGVCAFQQANGLWYDSGPGTNGTDGCGATGTVTQQKFLSDWLTVAQRYAGNTTVVGFDLDNEPLESAAVWGGGGVTDIHAMYTKVGNAIQEVDPGALIIAEGPIQWGSLYMSDLSHVKAVPVVLNIPHKVVYSVHQYPAEVGGEPFDSGSQYVQDMNTAWGYLEAQNIAPVWIGELGASMNDTDDTNWANTIIPYVNGSDGSQGGPTFAAPDKAVSTDWWCWCEQQGQLPDGLLDNNGNVRPEQIAITNQLH